MRYQVRPARSFLRAARRLARKYRRLKNDLRALHEVLSTDPHSGVAIPGFSHRVWKIRLVSSDVQKGKRGGYRVIYAIDEAACRCYPLFIYIKAEQADITVSEIERLLQDLENDLAQDT